MSSSQNVFDYLNDEDIQFLKDADAAFERLRQDPEAWAAYLADEQRWNAFVFAPSPQRDKDGYQ